MPPDAEEQTLGSEQNERLRWSGALGCWIGAVCLTGVLAICGLEVAFLIAEIYNAFLSGGKSFHPGGFVLVSAAIPVFVAWTILISIAPTTPIGVPTLLLISSKFATWTCVFAGFLLGISAFASAYLHGRFAIEIFDNNNVPRLGEGLTFARYTAAFVVQMLVLVIGALLFRRRAA